MNAPLMYLAELFARAIVQSQTQSPPSSPTADEKHAFWLSCTEQGIAVPPVEIKVKPAVSPTSRR